MYIKIIFELIVIQYIIKIYSVKIKDVSLMQWMGVYIDIW